MRISHASLIVDKELPYPASTEALAEARDDAMLDMSTAFNKAALEYTITVANLIGERYGYDLSGDDLVLIRVAVRHHLISYLMSDMRDADLPGLADRLPRLASDLFRVMFKENSDA